MIAVFVVGVIPFLLGLIFELVVVSPLRVGMDQSPLYFPAQVRAICRSGQGLEDTIQG